MSPPSFMVKRFLWIAVCICPVSTSFAQIHVLNDRAVARVFNQLQEVDFETLPVPSRDDPPLPNPLTIEGITFHDPTILRSGFCSSPTCVPDPDNPDGGNMSLGLNPAATVTFETEPRVVVLDLQGNGDNPCVLLVTDGRGRTKEVAAQNVLFGVTLVGVSSPAGIRSVEVREVGGSGGRLSLARILFK